MGYHRAGFEVVGVDINPQPHYPFDFEWADAMTYPIDDYFDIVHASPPCQGYTTMNHRGNTRETWPRLIDPLRERLVASGLPYVIENVPGARDQLRGPVTVCGTAFGLPIWRHRLFESNGLIAGTHCDHRKCPVPLGVYGPFNGRILNKHQDGNHQRAASSNEQAAAALGIDWPCSDRELAEAIPPAYTEWIGRQLLRAI